MKQIQSSMDAWLSIAKRKYDGSGNRKSEIHRNIVEGSAWRLGNWYWQESDEPDFFDDYDLEEGNDQYLMESADERRIEKHFKDHMEKERWYKRGKFRLITEVKSGGETSFYVEMR